MEALPSSLESPSHGIDIHTVLLLYSLYKQIRSTFAPCGHRGRDELGARQNRPSPIPSHGHWLSHRIASCHLPTTHTTTTCINIIHTHLRGLRRRGPAGKMAAMEGSAHHDDMEDIGLSGFHNPLFSSTAGLKAPKDKRCVCVVSSRNLPVITFSLSPLTYLIVRIHMMIIQPKAQPSIRVLWLASGVGGG